MAPAPLRGRYLALFSLSWGIGRTVAPGIVTALFTLGATWPWIGMIGTALLMMAISLNAERDLDPDRQRMARSISLHDDTLQEPLEQPAT